MQFLPDTVPMRTYKPPEFLFSKVLENKPLSPLEKKPDGQLNDTRHIVLDIKGKTPALEYFPGQSVGVNAPLLENGKPARQRLYSVASSRFGDDGAYGTVSLCVKRDLGYDKENNKIIHKGLCSNYLCDLKEGDEVKLTGPWGRHFLLPQDYDRPYILISTGTGIAPFRGMLEELFSNSHFPDLKMTNPMYLIFGVKWRTDILYNEEFEALASRHKNFHYIKAISREQKNKEGGRRYVQHAFEESFDELEDILRNERTRIYICGLKGMEGPIYRLLHKSLPGLYVKPLSGKDPDDPKTTFLKVKGKVFVEVY